MIPRAVSRGDAFHHADDVVNRSLIAHGLAADLAGRIKLVKVNVDDSPQLQQRFNVMAIPTLMVLRHGQVAAQRAGAVPAASLRAWVEEVLGN